MANKITGIRILCALCLIFCPAFSGWFYSFYLAGGISDILDGEVARHFGMETEQGARLDTIADIVFTGVILVKVWGMVYLPPWLILWAGVIAGIKIVNIISGFVVQKRFVSEHTILNKLSGVLLFVIPLCIGQFPWQPVAILVILTCIIAMIAAIQEGHYIRSNKEIV